VSIIAIVALVLISAILSVAFPLATYTFTLATFGLTHVLTEIHYVDNRFHKRLDHTLRLRILQLLLLIISFRIFQVLGFIPVWVSVPSELTCVVGLVALVVPVLGKKDWRLATLATAICLIITAGIYWASALTLLVFAILHNITPIGFIAEKLRGSEKYHALLACIVVFAVIPLVILSGLPYNFLSSMGLVYLDASLFSVGGLESALGAFVPPQLQDQAIAIHAFSAAVFLQSMHYTVVIGMLPKWEKADQERIINGFSLWYKQNQFRGLTTLLSGLLFMGFAVSFINARVVYAIAAAFHAWLEIPILLLALGLSEETQVID